jgi:hypothetical protein
MSLRRPRRAGRCRDGGRLDSGRLAHRAGDGPSVRVRRERHPPPSWVDAGKSSTRVDPLDWRRLDSWRRSGYGTGGAVSPAARLPPTGATLTTWSIGPTAGHPTSPTWRCCAGDTTPSPTETTSSVMSTPPAVLSMAVLSMELLSPGTSSPEATTAATTDPQRTVTSHRATHHPATHHQRTNRHGSIPTVTRPYPSAVNHQVTTSGTTLAPTRSPGQISGQTRTQRPRPGRRTMLPGAVTGPTPSPGQTCGRTRDTAATASPRITRTDTTPTPKQTRGTAQAARPRNRAASDLADCMNTI